MRYILIASLLFLTFSCKQKQGLTSNKKEKATIDELYQLMQGSFDSSAQAAEDEEFYDITLHMYPIWQNLEGEAKYLYVEQSVSANQSKPYRQRVYKLFINDANEYVSEVYKLPNEERWIGAWRNSRAWDGLNPEQLEIREGCEVIMTRMGDNYYKGKTGATTCKSTLRGAAYATSIVEVAEGKIESWDQGFNADGEQVWGAVKSGYVFLKTKDSRL